MLTLCFVILWYTVAAWASVSSDPCTTGEALESTESHSNALITSKPQVLLG